MKPLRLPIVGVMGSHEEEWEDYADPVGDLLARKGFNLLTGAGGGVMSVVARAFTHVTEREGRAIGILPAVDYKGQKLDSEEYPNPYIEIPMITPLSAKAQSDVMPFSRNLTNVMTSQALIILPGSNGTRNEVSLALLYNKPLIMFGPERAFAKFPEEPLRTDDITHVEQFLDDVFS
ncbi:MAG: DNA-binding protein [Bdellovibrionales bacterium]